MLYCKSLDSHKLNVFHACWTMCTNLQAAYMSVNLAKVRLLISYYFHIFCLSCSMFFVQIYVKLHKIMAKVMTTMIFLPKLAGHLW